VNILESVHLVSRKSKNLYNWHGLASLPKSIGDMKVNCFKPPSNVLLPAHRVCFSPCSNGMRKLRRHRLRPARVRSTRPSKVSQTAHNLPGIDREVLIALFPPGDRRRGKSLSKLSQMFVQLFLGKVSTSTHVCTDIESLQACLVATALAGGLHHPVGPSCQTTYPDGRQRERRRPPSEE
jgi:hypothetical protein